MTRTLLLIRPLIDRLERFWFRPISATGFAAMRISFAGSALLTMLLQWRLVDFFYGPSGILPRSIVPITLRHAYRFSLLDYVGSTGTTALYIVLLVSLVFVLVGLWTRWSLLVSVVLLFSFHEYGQITLDGGDTLQRLLGFLLLLSPCDRALSVQNLRRRMALAQRGGHEQAIRERQMPIWPYRLLLWQMICIYVASAIEKWSGSMWEDGSAMAIALHHDHFTRLSPLLQDLSTYLSPAGSLFVLLSQSAWGLLLLLPLLEWLGVIRHHVTPQLKRFLLVCGLIIHGLIFLLMDVGTFSLVIFSAYAGLLLDDDWRALRRLFDVGAKRKMSVLLFDGRCGLCQRSIVLLQSFDWLQRLMFANYHDPAVRKLYAPSISLKSLDEAMHLRSADGTTVNGFRAFQQLCRILPPLWPLVPIVMIPGVGWIGDKAYRSVASRRKKSA